MQMEQNLRLLLELVGAERILVRVPQIPEYNTRADQMHSVEQLQQMGIVRLDLFSYTVREQSAN